MVCAMAVVEQEIRRASAHGCRRSPADNSEADTNRLLSALASLCTVSKMVVCQISTSSVLFDNLSAEELHKERTIQSSSASVYARSLPEVGKESIWPKEKGS